MTAGAFFFFLRSRTTFRRSTHSTEMTSGQLCRGPGERETAPKLLSNQEVDGSTVRGSKTSVSSDDSASANRVVEETASDNACVRVSLYFRTANKFFLQYKISLSLLVPLV